MQITQAQMAHLDAITTLQSRAFSPAHDWMLSPRQLRYHLKKQTPFKLIFDGDRLVGYVLLFTRSGGRSVRIYMLAVDPCCRRQGLGRRLLGIARRWALEHHKTRLSLEVRADNQKALALYEWFGFQRKKALPSFYPGDRDGWRMQMCLN
jgi:ribosomal protein S18 acetylase RimI-like enzyme